MVDRGTDELDPTRRQDLRRLARYERAPHILQLFLVSQPGDPTVIMVNIEDSGTGEDLSAMQPYSVAGTVVTGYPEWSAHYLGIHQCNMLMFILIQL